MTQLSGSQLDKADGTKDGANVLVGDLYYLASEPNGTVGAGCACNGCCGDLTDVDLGTISVTMDDGGSPLTEDYTHTTWEALTDTHSDIIPDNTYVAARERVKGGGGCQCIIRVWAGKTSGIGLSDFKLAQGAVTAYSVDWATADVAGHLTYFGKYMENDALVAFDVGINGGSTCDLAGVTVDGGAGFELAFGNTDPVYTEGYSDPTSDL